MTHQGRHFLHIPGPSPIPDRVLRAMDMPIIDHRSAGFGVCQPTHVGSVRDRFAAMSAKFVTINVAKVSVRTSASLEPSLELKISTAAAAPKAPSP